MKKFMIAVVPTILVAAVLASTALAWHVNGVVVKAVCNTTTYVYDVSATIDQNSTYPGATVKSVSPSTFPGNTTGTKSVTVVVGWSTGESQTLTGSVTLDGKCVKPPTPAASCPEGTVKDETASTSTMLVCIKTVTNTVTVPGPTVYVDKPVPGPTVTVNVPGPTVTNTVFGNPNCPAGSTEISRGPGMVNCATQGPERIVVKVKKVMVYGTPHCLMGEKTIARGKGWVRCQVSKTKIIVRVVKAPKPAYTK